MQDRYFLNPIDLTPEKSLKTLVENRRIFNLQHCELNIFETYQEAEAVPLKFQDFVVTSMVKGKKVMHLEDKPEFDYLPGESVVVPSHLEMKIDFPEANKDNPTQCVALAIDKMMIKHTIDFLNERYPKNDDKDVWKLDFNSFYFDNNQQLVKSINTITNECLSNSIAKDVIADISLQELIIRIIQNQTQELYQSSIVQDSNNTIWQSVEYIKNNLFKPLNLNDLSQKAFMSPSSYNRYFKRELGMSPFEFILNERIKKAKKYLQNPEYRVIDVAYNCGFEDSNYFIRIFKRYEGITPRQYQNNYLLNKA